MEPNICTAGAVFAHQRQVNDEWDFQQKIAPDELGERDFFGQSIAMEGNRAVVGAFGDDDACPDQPPSLFCDPGAVYLFELIDDEWQPVDKYTASDADSSDFLGVAVAISGSHVIAGAPTDVFNDNPKPDLGAAYLFKIFNRDPVAQDDQANTGQNTPVEIDVLANDSDPDFDKITLKASLLAGPSNGTVTVSDTAISYTPEDGFVGTDTFTYEIDDGGTAQANVNINVINAAPVVAQAIDDIELILGGDAFTNDLTTVFSDPDGDALSFSASSSNAAVATATVSGQTLTVEAVALDSVTIMVTADDDHGGTASTSFTVNIPTGVAVEDGDTGLPTTFALEPNYPNPFNPETRIRFGLPESSEVRLAVFDVLGREVAVLVETRLPAGRHAAVFEAGELPSGVYVYQLQTARQTLSRTMLLLK